MKLTNLVLLAATATLATACIDGGSDCVNEDTAGNCLDDTDTDASDTDTQDTDVEDVTPMWNTGAWTNGWADFVDCGTAGEVTFHAETMNWGENVAVYVTQTEYYGAYVAWEEEHTLDEIDASDDNTGDGYSIFERTLDTNAALEDQASDTSTLWGCGARGEGNASLDPEYLDDGMETAFAIAVWAPGQATSEPPADCIYFGQNPDELADDLYTGGTGVDGSGRSIPGWFTKAGCTKVE